MRTDTKHVSRDRVRVHPPHPTIFGQKYGTCTDWFRHLGFAWLAFLISYEEQFSKIKKVSNSVVLVETQVGQTAEHSLTQSSLLNPASVCRPTANSCDSPLTPVQRMQKPPIVHSGDSISIWLGYISDHYYHQSSMGVNISCVIRVCMYVHMVIGPYPALDKRF